jgi:asparagine synthase (glutamine-hydrolysing)
MCGFVGLISNHKEKLSEKFLSRLLVHRGPDMMGAYKDNANGFQVYFNRLSIMDLSINGNQPFMFQDLVLVANCEIYNFKKIKKMLNNKYEFKSNSDAEVLLYAFNEWGSKFTDILEGMFSIAIYNKKKKEIYLFRDRFGIKPLYYFFDKDCFIFSSEFLPIIKIINKLKRIKNFNYNSINNFLYCGYNYENTTHIENVFKVKPSHSIFFKNFEIKESKYWELKKNHTNYNLEDSTGIVDQELSRSVQSHLASDVPISILLSGGLDSSLITYYSKKNSIEKNISTITINMDNQLSNDEIDNINFLKNKFKIENKMLEVSSKNIIKDIEKNVDVYDDLQSADAGYLTNNEIAKRLKENNFKVVLVGDGSDEIFGGYSWFGLSKFPFKLLNERIKNLFYFYAISRTINFTKITNIVNGFNNNIKNLNGSYFDKICQNELFYQLPNNYLMKVDKPFMRNSIESRVPYLDHLLVEKIYNLPNEFKLFGKSYFISSFKKANEKFILRNVAKKIFKNFIFQTKKRGFSISTSTLINQNKDIFFDVLNDSKAYLGYEKRDNLIKDIYNIAEKKYHPIMKHREILLWKLFLFNIWKKNV